MKYKFPKSIVIGDTKFHITYDEDKAGACFNYPNKGEKAYIKFGMANFKANPNVFLSMVLHEFKEILHIEQSTRYTNRSDDSFLFMSTHAQHEQLCNDLVRILNKFIC